MKKLILSLMLLSVFACKKSIDEKKIKVSFYENKKEIVKQEPLVEKTQGILVCDDIKKDFGKIKKNDLVYQKFRLNNIGTETVTILEFDASCNCTSLEISKKSIQPGDSTIVTMKVETKEKSKGLHAVNATLKTNGKRTFYALSTSFEVE
jgi:hypothetical protein